MPITEWSDTIVIVELSDEPMFSEDMDSLTMRLGEPESSDSASANHDVPDVILDMKAVSHVNSSNLAQLLKVRKRLQLVDRRLRVCSVRDRVWGVLLVTGLDGLFEFTEDVSTSLASLQIDG